MKIWIFLLLSLIIVSCTNGTDSDTNKPLINAPEHFPEMAIPVDNPLNHAKVELGRHLFYDPILSENYTFACENCHYQKDAFAHSGHKMSVGATGEPELRNTMPLFNTGYYKVLFWDGHGSKVEAPAYRGIWLPMIFDSDTNKINHRLANSEKYKPMFKAAFGENVTPDCWHAALAIASFVRTIVSGNSAYDRYLLGDEDAMTESQKRGMKLFFSDTVNCSDCHTGIFFSDEKFHNTGTTTHYFDRGRFYVTGKYEDRSKFKTPTLRNVELTGPYMADGYIETLEEVIDNYNTGGLPFFSKDTLMRPLNLNSRQKRDLVSFLKALTDWELTTNEKYSKPE